MRKWRQTTQGKFSLFIAVSQNLPGCLELAIGQPVPSLFLKILNDRNFLYFEKGIHIDKELLNYLHLRV